MFTFFLHLLTYCNELLALNVVKNYDNKTGRVSQHKNILLSSTVKIHNNGDINKRIIRKIYSYHTHFLRLRFYLYSPQSHYWGQQELDDGMAGCQSVIDTLILPLGDNLYSSPYARPH